MLHTFSQWLIGFTFYSFLGWLCESIYCSIPAKRFINRGFLNGPFCPVYGFGALLVLFILQPFSDNMVLIFLFGMLITSLLEYITSYLLEKLFHTSWWDYSNKRFNIRGRVCLKNSLLFGALCVLLVLLIHPLGQMMAASLPAWLLPGLSWCLLAYFIGDTVLSVYTILRLNGKLQQIHGLRNDIESKKQEAKHKIQQNLEQRLDDDIKAKIDLLIQKKKELEQNSKWLQRRLIAAFPQMRSIRHPDLLLRIKQEIENRRAKRNEK